MITYSDLIQTGILVVGIIGLFIAANKKKVPPLAPQLGDYFRNTIEGANRLPAAPSLFIAYHENKKVNQRKGNPCRPHHPPLRPSLPPPPLLLSNCT